MSGQVLATFTGGPRGQVRRDVQRRAKHMPGTVEMHRGGEADIYTLMPGTTATYRYVRTVNRSAADR